MLTNKFSKITNAKDLLFLAFSYFFVLNNLLSNEIYYVQSPKAKLLVAPKIDSQGATLNIGSSLKKVSESGLFYQVRYGEKTGFVSKLFISAFPPGKQIKLGTTHSSNEQALGRQRASDFTKTAAARGLSETEKLRLRGASSDFDFDSVRWLENIGQASVEQSLDNVQVIDESKNSSFFDFSSNPLPSETKAEVKMGRILAAKLIQKYGLVKNEEFTIYLNNLGQSITQITSRQDLSFRFGILDSSEINAFACPGGFIFLTRAAVENTKNESELVGILSHEISHVVLNHHGEIATDNAFLEIISSLLATPSIEIVSTASLTALEAYEEEFYEKGRDIETEYEADESAVQLMVQLGYLPHNFIKYIENISKIPNENSILKTHPSTSQRVNKIENILKSMGSISDLKNSDEAYIQAKKSL